MMGTNNVKQQHSFRTLGLKIDFPFPPYGTQRAMMNKITSTLCNHEHSLIESPTGTGKTLVLLCSALAWRARSKEVEQPFISNKMRQKNIRERLEKLKARPCSCGSSDYIDLDCNKKLDYGDDDCQIIDNPIIKKPKKDNEIQAECDRCKAIQTEEDFIKHLGDDHMSPDDIRGKARGNVPRIYYGTRTHKQITQVVRELNKTSYCKDLKMCILSSRERTCINEDVKDYSDRNERCQNLINNFSSTNSKKKNAQPTCQYYQESNQLKALYEQINEKYNQDVWDIEQLVEFGREHKACPYFGVRKLQDEADITFCPYNYLLDPTIRSNLDINIKNSIIIIDEAHNLEDICRDSASFIIDTKQIDSIIETMNLASSLYIQGSSVSDAFSFFRDRLNKIKYFLHKFEFDPADLDTFDKSEKQILTNERMLRELESLGLGPNDIEDIKKNLKALKGDDEDMDDKSSTKNDDSVADSKLSTNQLQFIRQLAITLDFMYSKSSLEVKSDIAFRAVVAKMLDKEPARFDRRRSVHQTADQVSNDQVHIWQLSIFCMNPAVAFAQIHKDAWSVIVASGTLSPIESLKTELGCTFTQPFEGGHVISSERIFASIVSFGPKRKELNCSWQNSQTLDFQDEVGYVVRDVCKIVPKGVLCFFPSYDRMDTFSKRWLAKGIIKDIEIHKGSIFKEEKRLSASDFEKVLVKYNKKANKTGALLMAVFRGKVSEGIDFADDAARAVITIGIPYPNVREVSVGLKKEYNDVIRKTSPQIMTGGDWYACQAFRALNQALGRCIRHKEDWGSIILIDSRLRHSSRNLSKWLQNNLVNTTNYDEIKQRLVDFVDSKKQNGIGL